MSAIIREEIQETIKTKQALLAEVPAIEKIASTLVEALRSGHKLLICGNGGSAADAQHFAGELVGRFTRERKALPALALSTDSSVLTCVGNDYGYDKVFARQVEALGARGDVLVAISTSGSSANVLAAVAAAKARGMRVVALTGAKGKKIAGVADVTLAVPSENTQRIQESHITVIHILCSLIEKALFS